MVKAYLVFGPDGIGISVFSSASAPEELSKFSFAVWEIESSTDIVLAGSVADVSVSAEPDL